eukprot:7379820-Prymnesium_polylepis.1
MLTRRRPHMLGGRRCLSCDDGRAHRTVCADVGRSVGNVGDGHVDGSEMTRPRSAQNVLRPSTSLRGSSWSQL